VHVDLREALPALVELIEGHLDREASDPVRRPQDADTLRQELDLALTEQGLAFGDVVEQLHEVLAVTPTTASDRFFNQLFGGRDGAAVVGEALAGVLNNSMYTYKVAGVHVLLELELVRRMGGLLGFEDPEGVFTPGGSLSNLAGMVMARNQAVPDLMDHGSHGRKLRVYSSVDAHYSIRKAASILGIGRENVVKIAVDARGRMDPQALAAAIAADRQAGHLPIMINATSGTTVLGAFDPLEPLADIAEREGIWLHVDAAYGGSMVFHPEFGPQFAGVDRADSVTWDAHKMMGVPLTCSVILARHKGYLTKHFNETASYLFQDDTDDLNPGTRSIQCGRRNDVLKLWTAWKTHGDQGYRDRMVRLRDNTLYARDLVEQSDRLHLVREPESLNLCFTVDGVRADRLCTAMNRAGRAMVGHAFVNDRPVVRLVFLDPTVGRPAIDTFFQALLQTAAEGPFDAEESK